MTGKDDFLVHVLELLAPLPRVAAQSIIGGHGLNCDSLFFGIAHHTTLYLTAYERNRVDFERAGCPIFSYSRNGRRATLNFHRAPEDAMDTPKLMLPWARGALSAASRTGAGRPRWSR